MFVKIMTLGDQVATGGVFVVSSPNEVPSVVLASGDGPIAGRIPVPVAIDLKLFPGEIVDMTDRDLFDQLYRAKMIEEVIMKDLPKEERYPTRPLQFTDADEAKEFRKRYHRFRNPEIVDRVKARLRDEYPLNAKGLPKCKEWDSEVTGDDMVEIE